MKDASILPNKCADIATRIATGELTREQGAFEIMTLVHDERWETIKRTHDEAWKAFSEKVAA
jgi:hypothetical protein